MSTQKIQTVIAATPEQVWAAITDANISPAYYYGFVAHYDDLTAGAPYEYRVGDAVMIAGDLREVVEGEKIGMTFRGQWTPAVAELPESIVTYELGPTAMNVPGLTQLTLMHEGLPDTETAREVEKGWVLILSGLKTLLETGRPLVPAPSH
jgi:uncharacterized protein YndB with AHSA1/START domain